MLRLRLITLAVEAGDDAEQLALYREWFREAVEPSEKLAAANSLVGAIRKQSGVGLDTSRMPGEARQECRRIAEEAVAPLGTVPQIADRSDAQTVLPYAVPMWQVIATTGTVQDNITHLRDLRSQLDLVAARGEPWASLIATDRNHALSNLLSILAASENTGELLAELRALPDTLDAKGRASQARAVMNMCNCTTDSSAGRALRDLILNETTDHWQHVLLLRSEALTLSREVGTQRYPDADSSEQAVASIERLLASLDACRAALPRYELIADADTRPALRVALELRVPTVARLDAFEAEARAKLVRVLRYKVRDMDRAREAGLAFLARFPNNSRADEVRREAGL